MLFTRLICWRKSPFLGRRTISDAEDAQRVPYATRTNHRPNLTGCTPRLSLGQSPGGCARQTPPKGVLCTKLRMGGKTPPQTPPLLGYAKFDCKGSCATSTLGKIKNDIKVLGGLGASFKKSPNVLLTPKTSKSPCIYRLLQAPWGRDPRSPPPWSAPSPVPSRGQRPRELHPRPAPCRCRP